MVTLYMYSEKCRTQLRVRFNLSINLSFHVVFSRKNTYDITYFLEVIILGHKCCSIYTIVPIEC